MRAVYERPADLDDALRQAGELGARTIIFDVEPLVAYWDSGQGLLDEGVAWVLKQARTAVPGLLVLCFATNSRRRPSAAVVSDGGRAGGDAGDPGGAGGADRGGDQGAPAAGARVVYLAAARKPLRTAQYRDFPRPGVVVGDQVVTDGVLAWRLGYRFLHYSPELAHVPAGPRLLGYGGLLVRPLLFSRGAAPAGRSQGRH